jgi:Fe2+ or Zn2+ uptake regulation protein
MADLPEVVTMARKSLKQANSVESRQAADFLKQYFTERDIPQDDTIIDELLSLAERTDSRSTVFSALDALVENGAICEFEAMSRMDDWKSKHRL